MGDYRGKKKDKVIYDVEYKSPNQIVSIVDQYEDVTIIGSFDFIKTIFPEFIKNNHSIEYIFDFATKDKNGYGKEYYMTICENQVGIEPAWSDKCNQYLEDSCNVVFMHEDCNSKILDYIRTGIVFMIIEPDEGKDESTENDSCLVCDNTFDLNNSQLLVYNDDPQDNMHGFSASYNIDGNNVSVSYYSTDKDSVENNKNNLVDYLKNKYGEQFFK